MTNYDIFVNELKRLAVLVAAQRAPVRGVQQAENDAVHLVGDGMALVTVEEAVAEPVQAAERFAAWWQGMTMPMYDREKQWSLCPISKYHSFLRLVDVGATVRSELEGRPYDRISADAARIVEATDLEDSPDTPEYRRNAPDPLAAAIDFLRSWPDFTHAFHAPWLRQAIRKNQN